MGVNQLHHHVDGFIQAETMVKLKTHLGWFELLDCDMFLMEEIQLIGGLSIYPIIFGGFFDTSHVVVMVRRISHLQGVGCQPAWHHICRELQGEGRTK